MASSAWMFGMMVVSRAVHVCADEFRCTLEATIMRREHCPAELDALAARDRSSQSATELTLSLSTRVVLTHTNHHITYYGPPEGTTIIFYYCNLFISWIFKFVSIDERPAMGSQPNLASRSKVVSIYKSPKMGAPTPKFETQKQTFWPLFSQLPHSTLHISGTKRHIDKPKC